MTGSTALTVDLRRRGHVARVRFACPSWCRKDHSLVDCTYHYGAHSTIDTGHALVSTSLVRDDDLVTTTTYVSVEIENMDGASSYGDAWLTVEEARRLRAQLDEQITLATRPAVVKAGAR